MARRAALSWDGFASRRPVLQEMYDGSSSPQATAKVLASMATFEVSEGQLSMEAGAGVTWGFLVTSARELPEHHGLLVDLMVCFSTMDHIGGDGEVERLYGMRVWRDFPMLGWDLNGEWNSLDVSPHPGPKRTAQAAQILNVNKFCALLMLTDVPRFDYQMFALWTMRQALETPMEQATFRHCPEVYVPAAASWILLLGSRIYHWDTEFEHGPTIGAPGRGDALWPGKHGFCEERWTLWRIRFDEFASMGPGIGEEVKLSASKAAMRMREIEAVDG
ncbi:hypothetical protein LTR97_002931 [Elasticomyces elasticus]|uniref:Uncharacterized protein n=1 Tax=Elasticomyces elasticus TaxID=574655 RepID=A0AAN7ZV54_9PEZI|nr:hypothetical protein LTR97_002931 [Elasticomyces elasticus]